MESKESKTNINISDVNKSDNKKNDNNFVKLIKLLSGRLMTREVITYLVAGVLTTFINITAAYIANGLLGIEELISNTIAWVVAVAFAYIVNSMWVFRSRFISARNEISKILKFVSGRIASFLIEQAGILIFVKLLDFNFMLVKAALAVIVIILNYIISKLFVFTKNGHE